MRKRCLKLGDYVTSVPGFTLCSLALSPAVYRAVRETIPGMDGDADCTDLLTGHAVYNSRTLTAVLELSEGNRMYRKGVIEDMLNRLDGHQMQIVLPDDPCRYLTGRVHVEQQYNDMAHAAVKLTAVCEPWRYDRNDRVYLLQNDALPQRIKLRNQGRKTVCPTFITGAECIVQTDSGVMHTADNAGTYQWDDILLAPGTTQIMHSGGGTLEIHFREAIL